MLNIITTETLTIFNKSNMSGRKLHLEVHFHKKFDIRQKWKPNRNNVRVDRICNEKLIKFILYNI